MRFHWTGWYLVVTNFVPLSVHPPLLLLSKLTSISTAIRFWLFPLLMVHGSQIGLPSFGRMMNFHAFKKWVLQDDQTSVLQRTSQITKAAQISQLWPDHHTGSPVPAPSQLLYSLLSERRCFTLHLVAIGIQMACLSCQMWGSCCCLYICCHLHWKPLELFSGRKAASGLWNHCFISTAVCSSASLPCNTGWVLNHRGFIPSQPKPSSMLCDAF